MRILNVVKTSEGALWAFNQAYELSKLGHEIITVLPKKEGSVYNKYLEKKLSICCEDFSLPIKKPFEFFKRKKRINDLIKRIEPDIIHCHFFTNIIMMRLSLKRSKVPRLFQVPGPLHLENLLFRYLDFLTITDYDFIGAGCKKTMEYYKTNRKINSNNVFLTYYGGYGGEEIEKYTNKKNIRNIYNLPEDAFVVGMVSYFYKPKYYILQTKGIKGHEFFISAISCLVTEDSNIYGVIIGKAWDNSHKYEQKIKKIAKRKCDKNLLFTGYRSDLKDIYKSLNVVVHPSLSENLGGAAESLAAAVPTIATNVGGFPDIVLDNKTGYLINKKSVKDIVNSVKKVRDNYGKALEMSKNGSKVVMELLDINRTVSQIDFIYNKIKGENL